MIVAVAVIAARSIRKLGVDHLAREVRRRRGRHRVGRDWCRPPLHAARITNGRARRISIESAGTPPRVLARTHRKAAPCEMARGSWCSRRTNHTVARMERIERLGVGFGFGLGLGHCRSRSAARDRRRRREPRSRRARRAAHGRVPVVVLPQTRKGPRRAPDGLRRMRASPNRVATPSTASSSTSARSEAASAATGFICSASRSAASARSAPCSMPPPRTACSTRRHSPRSATGSAARSATSRADELAPQGPSGPLRGPSFRNLYERHVMTGSEKQRRGACGAVSHAQDDVITESENRARVESRSRIRTRIRTRTRIGFGLSNA